MNSLLNYGSDDDCDDSSDEKLTENKCGGTPPPPLPPSVEKSHHHHHHRHQRSSSSRQEVDVNYEEVQMDLSEESNDSSKPDRDASTRSRRQSKERESTKRHDRGNSRRDRDVRHRDRRDRERKSRRSSSRRDRSRSRSHERNNRRHGGGGNGGANKKPPPSSSINKITQQPPNQSQITKPIEESKIDEGNANRFFMPGITGRFREQIERRKLLWQKKEPEVAKPMTSVAVRNTNQNPSTTGKVWEATTFAQDTDGKVASKFKRLMGIKGASDSDKPGGDGLKKQEEMFSSMEQQYEVARTATHTMRGVGLGFGSYQR